MKQTFKSVLLAGCALGAMAATAQADELSALKAQLEALQSRVNSIETTGPATSAGAPAGASYMTFRRGSLDVEGQINDLQPDDRGFTVAITPTADLPAPVMEVSVSGYVKADFIYDTHNNQGRSATPTGVAIGGGDDENFQAFANQSRFRIRSRSDTAVGQIRTLIEGDFEGSGSGTQAFRLRHAWGEWDLTPNLTLGAGQTWATKYHFAGEIPTVDFGGMVGTSGFAGSRVAQIQIKSSTGPVSWAVGLQNPNAQLAAQDTQLPDLAAKANFDLLGGQVGISGIVREIHIDGSTNGVGAGSTDSAFGWGISAGIDLPLGDMITLHATGGYGDGADDIAGSPAGVGGVVVGGNIRTNESYGWGAGASLRLSEASSINAAYSYAHASSDNLPGAADQTWEKVHLNYMWQPVSKLRMGLEGIYTERTLVGGVDDDNIRLQFGTWFFF